MTMLQPLRREIQYAASLDGGLDGFLARRSANHRKKLRQALRRAAESGVGFERHAPASAEEVRRIFRRMLAVERLSWKGIDRCGMDQPWGRIFYDSMLRRLAMSSSGRVMFAIQTLGKPKFRWQVSALGSKNLGQVTPADFDCTGAV